MTIIVVKKSGHVVTLTEPDGALLLIQEDEKVAIYAQSFSIVSPHIAKLYISKP
jgi:hypothetical protein